MMVQVETSGLRGEKGCHGDFPPTLFANSIPNQTMHLNLKRRLRATCLSPLLIDP